MNPFQFKELQRHRRELEALSFKVFLGTAGALAAFLTVSTLLFYYR